jgi:hypothetical protein
MGVMVRLKEYDCVQVDHHKRIAEVIEDYQKDGWHLHTYQAQGSPTIVNHYLLFEREKSKKTPTSVQAAAAAAAAAAAG